MLGQCNATIYLQTLTGTECPGISWESSALLLKRPSRGPRKAAPNREHVPPRRWIGPQPEKSLYPIWFSHPSSAHTQRLTTGYTKPGQAQSCVEMIFLMHSFHIWIRELLSLAWKDVTFLWVFYVCMRLLSVCISIWFCYWHVWWLLLATYAMFFPRDRLTDVLLLKFWT